MKSGASLWCSRSVKLGFYMVNAGGLGIDNFFGDSDLQKMTK